MNTLSTSYIQQYYCVKDNTIFEIRGYSSDDVCEHSADSISGNIPSITVTRTSDSNVQTLYLDIYIKDGDTYSDNIFKKTIHKSAGSEESKLFGEYYTELCQKEIDFAISTNFDKDWEWFERNLNVLGVPKFMINGQGYTISSNCNVSQITFNQTVLNDAKDRIAKDEVTKAAKKRAESLGYDLVEKKSDDDECGTYTDIILEKKS